MRLELFRLDFSDENRGEGLPWMRRSLKKIKAFEKNKEKELMSLSYLAFRAQAATESLSSQVRLPMIVRLPR